MVKKIKLNFFLLAILVISGCVGKGNDPHLQKTNHQEDPKVQEQAISDFAHRFLVLVYEEVDQVPIKEIQESYLDPDNPLLSQMVYVYQQKAVEFQKIDSKPDAVWVYDLSQMQVQAGESEGTYIFEGEVSVEPSQETQEKYDNLTPYKRSVRFELVQKGDGYRVHEFYSDDLVAMYLNKTLEAFREGSTPYLSEGFRNPYSDQKSLREAQKASLLEALATFSNGNIQSFPEGLE